MRVLPVGPRALLVELADEEAVLGLHAEIGRRRRAGWQESLTDVVPAACTVLLDGLDDPRGAAADLLSWPRSGGARLVLGRLVELPTVYDGADLDEVARCWGMTRREAVATHAGTAFHVAFCGFSPGFAYLAGLPHQLAVPRRPTPRPAVSAGTVALAGQHTGIYPRRSPGGWQLIGRTDVVLWDVDREPAALLPPGTRVRFVEVEA
ncbi:MAG: 5-oxoprolinase subunit B family protein [Acidimicrobiales bacterium]